MQGSENDKVRVFGFQDSFRVQNLIFRVSGWDQQNAPWEKEEIWELIICGRHKRYPSKFQNLGYRKIVLVWYRWVPDIEEIFEA